jgi:hypothetical protein
VELARTYAHAEGAALASCGAVVACGVAAARGLPGEGDVADRPGGGVVTECPALRYLLACDWLAADDLSSMTTRLWWLAEREIALEALRKELAS